MNAIASQIISVCSGADQRKHQSSASMAFMGGGVNSPVSDEFPAQSASNAEMFPFDNVIVRRHSMRANSGKSVC